MGKKAKVGKQRRDKYYHLAKETGYRSRSAYKLLQLNRKFEFLQKSRVLIDLCAAPGGWLQVASKNMPVSSVVIGVDLYPIKPIPRVTTLVADITTEKCRQGLRKELNNWKADCVLHDGAPNVGANWLLDAHTQARLTLQAAKLACEFLNKGGWFVSKVFRSRDYQSLIWVFHQLFRKVHATKPQASRNESAEIFVVCQGFISPDKIDPKFFDPKHIFKDLPVDDPNKKLTIFQDPTKAKKVKAEGYADGEMSLYHKVNMTDFLNSEDPVTLLNNCSELIFDVEEIASHRLTTDEIRECAKDIKVLGRREIRLFLSWHKSMKTVLENAAKWHKQKEEEAEKRKKDEEERESSEEDEEDLKKKLEELQEEERIADRRLKKATAKKKRKIREKLQKLGMMQNAAEDEAGQQTESSLFKLQKIKSKSQLTEVSKGDLSLLDEEESEDEDIDLPARGKREFKAYKRRLVDPAYPEDANDDVEDSDDLPSDLDEDEVELLKKERAQSRPKSKEESDSDLDSDLEESEDINPLMVDLDEADDKKRSQRTTSLWFSKEAFSGLEGEDDEDLEISQMTEHYKKIGGSIREKTRKEEPDEEIAEEKQTEQSNNSSRHVSFNTTVFSMDESGKKEEEDVLSEDEDDETPGKGNKGDDENGVGDDEWSDESGEDSDYDDDILLESKKEKIEEDRLTNKSTAKRDGFEIVSADQPAAKVRKLDPVGLAIGTMIATSKKKRREIIEHGYNRYTYGDEDGLPGWFVKDERIHSRRIMPVTKEMVNEYKERLKEINARPIKKIAQAKARKKLRQMRKMEKIKKKAEAIGDTVDTSEKEKYSQIKNLYKKAGLDGKRRKDVAYVVAKKGLQGKRVKRPRGLKGPYKVVDKRMKTDLRGKAATDARKKKMRKKHMGR